MAKYQAEVVAGGKLYKLFAMDFLNSHHHIDRLDAAGLNEHRKNLGILRGILFARKDLLVRFSEMGKPDDGLTKDLLHLYYTTEAPPPGCETGAAMPSATHPNHSLSLGCCLDDDQLSLIADCANEARVFVETIDADARLSFRPVVPARADPFPLAEFVGTGRKHTQSKGEQTLEA